MQEKKKGQKTALWKADKMMQSGAAEEE